MAEHRRVESRTALAGTGMATDVDRVQDLEGEYDRRARAWRDAPVRGFGEVLDEAPPKGELEEGEHPDPRRRPKRPPDAPAEVEMAKAAASAPAEVPSAPAPARATSRSGPRLPPDPRAAALHQKLRKKVLGEPLRPPQVSGGKTPEPARIAATPGDTPPTGNPGQRTRKP